MIGEALLGNLAFTFGSLFYSTFLIYSYFKKKHYGIIENKIYSGLILSNFGGIIIHLLCAFAPMNDKSIMSFIFTRLYLSYLIIWMFLITYYVYVISLNTDEKRVKFKRNLYMFSTGVMVISIISLIICGLLPINFVHEVNGSIYITGAAPNFVYGLSALSVCEIIYCMLRNIKNLLSKTYIPIFTFIFVSGVVIIIQSKYPSLLLMTALETFITVMMYFTIENPDIKMMEEFTNSKLKTEKNNKERETFLVNLYQKTKKPTQDVDRACNELLQLTTNKKVLNKIDYISKQNMIVSYITNTLLSFEGLTIEQLPHYETKYDITKLMKGICKEYTKTIDNEKIDLRIEIERNIPTLLYGDGSKVKQILILLIKETISLIDGDYLEIGLHAIIKDNICRILIRTEVQTNQISQEEINDLLFNKKVTDKTRELSEIIEISNSLGANFYMSNAGQLKMSFILDQVIVKRNSDVLKNIEKYDEFINVSKIMIVSEDINYLESATRKLSRLNFNVLSTTMSEKCIARVRNKEKFNYILLDENLSLLNINETLNKLKEMRDFDAKVFVLTNEKNDLKYIKNGFDGQLSKKIIRSEIQKMRE